MTTTELNGLKKADLVTLASKLEARIEELESRIEELKSKASGRITVGKGLYVLPDEIGATLQSLSSRMGQYKAGIYAAIEATGSKALKVEYDDVKQADFNPRLLRIAKQAGYQGMPKEEEELHNSSFKLREALVKLGLVRSK